MTTMTKVIRDPNDGSDKVEVLGEIESDGISLGWKRGTLSETALAAVRGILQRAGGMIDGFFAMQHGALLVRHCSLIRDGAQGQFSFDGTVRTRTR